ncbi:ZIP family metal transporter [Thioalkalivibrio thiocyanodenitrificans]|uniref:ZIP family metal transporter n=1 Tax=Thioalkalivibrio thiocyanodenitrificans TaxID=243063 RepID=UPI000360C05F|nr:ZIP family metal transporter [Thioalkalivibrio thiocyanodenitrificans]
MPGPLTEDDNASHGWVLPLLALCVALLLILAVVNHWAALQARLADLGTVQLGLLASLAAGLFTAVGALPVMVLSRIRRRVEDALMGFGAGVMLAATAFSLVLPGVDAAAVYTGHTLSAALLVGAGIALGGLFLLACHRYVPHEHFIIGPQSGADPEKMRRIWLFVFAIALHNFPEGLAVGVGFGTGDLAAGVALTIGIGLQNMPEGLVVAVAMLTLGYSRWTALGVALLTGLVQPVGGLFGAAVVTLAAPLLPFGLAFAAGAMLFVISHEIIPESHRKGHEGHATLGVLVGFIVMMVLDVALD